VIRNTRMHLIIVDGVGDGAVVYQAYGICINFIRTSNGRLSMNTLKATWMRGQMGNSQRVMSECCLHSEWIVRGKNSWVVTVRNKLEKHFSAVEC